MSGITASVIVVSRHRTNALLRCLVSLAQQDHPQFEVIVVADPAGIEAAQAQGFAVKLAPFDEANISAARNVGLGLASAPVVAFIDDDAVAEPTWLSRLVAPFANPAVVAATGFIRGRNGISYQWQAAEVNAQGQDHPLPSVEGLYPGTALRAVKTQGTNCAFRRGALAAVGGFDPAYRFYLDEADVNLRLGPLGLTAVVPGAEVLHGYAASARRRSDRVPLTLHEIAASTAVFLRRHAPDALAKGQALLIRSESARVDALRAAGRITAVEEAILLTTLASGWAEGMIRPLPTLAPLPEPLVPLQPLPGTGPRAGVVIAGRSWQRARLMARARAECAAGKIVTVVCLAPSPRAHRVELLPEGIWLQAGGLFGRSDRNTPRLRLKPFRWRIAEELARIAMVRPIS